MAARSLKLAFLLAPCVLASIASYASAASPRTLKTHFSYTTTVASVPPGSKELRLWIPVPSDNKYQHISHLTVDSPAHYKITTEPKFGNRMVFVQYDKPIVVTVSYDVDRQEISLLDSGGARASRSELNASLRPDAKVPVGGKFADIAKEVTANRTGAIDRVRAIFEHIVATMEYDYKKESPHLGEGDVAFVCDYKKGNCSDLHSYLISLARSEGIPAYLEYGLPITGIPVPSPIPATGKIGGYHCWVWFYDAQKGWLPVDASDGRRWLDAKKPEVKDSLVGSLVLERSAVAISKGRDLVLSPSQSGPPLNNFIYPYAESDGKPVAADWEITYRLLP